MEELNENIIISKEEKQPKTIINNGEKSFEKLFKIQNLVKKQSALNKICNF